MAGPLDRLPTRRLSIRQKLLGAFGVDLLLMMFLGAFALMQMGVVREQAEEVAGHALPSIRNVDRIQSLVDRYRRLQLEFALYSNLGDRARTERDLIETERQMTELFEAHSGFLSRPAERRAFEELKTEWNEYVTATHSRFLPAIRRGNTGTVQPALSRLNPLHHRLTAAGSKLKALESATAEQALAVLHRTQQTSRTFILVDTAVSLAISAFVGLTLAATLSRRIRRLTKATQRVASGDLATPGRDQEASLLRDEITLLADNFEKMVESLRHQRDSLENRHEELRASLEQQRRLTRDLMLRKESEEAADRARAEAEARDSAKSIFLATMSHELRTPLNAVLGYVQLMTLEAQAKGDDASVQDLNRISSAGKHLATLISNLLDFSKIEQGKVEVEILEFSVADLVREVVDISQSLIDRENTRFRLEIDDAIGSMTSDPGKLRQILFNLLSNAAKFTERGEISLEVEPATDKSGEWIRMRVRDTGIGISSEHLEVIFEPFRQADSSISRRFGGTGLGLVISKKLSLLLGGSLSVESVVGEGSVFSVSLPRLIGPPKVTAVSADGSLPSVVPSAHPSQTELRVSAKRSPGSAPLNRSGAGSSQGETLG